MSQAHNKRHLDFDLNLVPFIDLLSVCICFLLLTAVWIQVGTLNAKQAVGGQAVAETLQKATLWISIEGNGKLVIDVRDSRLPSRLTHLAIPPIEQSPDFTQLESLVRDMQRIDPGITEVLLRPQAAAMYENIIGVMDLFRKLGMINQGVVPL